MSTRRPKSRHGEPLRFIHEIALQHTSSECLIWPYARMKRGYGELRQGKTMVYAHRVICELAHGPAPSPSHQVAHSCGHGFSGCVNPTHLRWATQKENEADKALHGKQNRGERHGLARLTESIVREIRQELRDGVPQLKIAGHFGISQTTIHRIKTRNTWGWLSD